MYENAFCLILIILVHDNVNNEIYYHNVYRELHCDDLFCVNLTRPVDALIFAQTVFSVCL